MTISQGVLMGVVQGLTEFLPVSSSGHLALAREILGAGPAKDVGFEVAVHAGTLLAVLIFFRAKLWSIMSQAWRDEGSGRRWIWWVFIGTIPAGIAGIAIKDDVENLFNNIHLVGAAWLFTALILFLSERRKEGLVGGDQAGWKRALFVGLAQAVALIPGVSRSGATIAAGLVCGLRRNDAVEFTFILSIPAICGAIFLTLLDWSKGTVQFEAADLAGAVAAGITGYLAIAVMLRVVSARRLSWFALYCAVLGVVALVW